MYPPEAVAAHVEGTTVVQFKITTAGSAKDISIHTSSGFKPLDDAAVACASEWKYKPATDKDGKPVEVPWKAQIVWDLKDYERSKAAPSQPPN